MNASCLNRHCRIPAHAGMKIFFGAQAIGTVGIRTSTEQPANPTPDVVILPDIDQQVWVEPPYKVVIHNDHVTTFEFVEKLLRTLFQKSEFEAAQIATETHRRGKALVCVRPQSEAEGLARKGIFAARMEGFPLMLSTEPDDG